MYTSTERKGLILLLILLVLVMAFVVCRHAMHNSKSTSLQVDSISKLIVSDSVPSIPINSNDSVKTAKKERKAKSKSQKSSKKREYTTRHPLSEPVN